MQYSSGPKKLSMLWLDLLGQQSARVHQPILLLAEVLLAGALPLEVLLVAEEEKEFAVSGLLEKKGMILLGLEILGQEWKASFHRSREKFSALKGILFVSALIRSVGSGFPSGPRHWRCG